VYSVENITKWSVGTTDSWFYKLDEKE
jgi:hypothetical protein